MEWYLAVLRNYVGFSGRAHRPEYWYFTLFNFLITMGIGFFEQLVGVGTGDAGGPLSGLYSLAVFVPSLAVGVRRLHDSGRTGLWLLLLLLPVLGWLVLLFFMVLPGDADPNEYGPVPSPTPE